VSRPYATAHRALRPPPPATEVTWTDLLARRDVAERCDLRSPVGVLAFHGGLEAGTLEIARATAAAAGASLYTVEQPEDLRWHVPSAAVDPARSPALAAFTDHVVVAVAVHGYGRGGRPWDVLLGGTNRQLASLLADELARHPPLVGVHALEDIPTRLRGLHPANPVNLPPAGGVQVELPVRARLPRSRRAVVGAVVTAIGRWHPEGAGGATPR
jgi:phage replication-related protein YjqB (UPF0714/DUF867 family)